MPRSWENSKQLQKKLETILEVFETAIHHTVIWGDLGDLVTRHLRWQCVAPLVRKLFSSLSMILAIQSTRWIKYEPMQLLIVLCFLNLYTMFAFSKVLYNHRVIRWDKNFLFTYEFQISRVSPVQMFDPTVIYSLTQLSDLPSYSLKERQKTGPIFKKNAEGFFPNNFSLYIVSCYTLSWYIFKDRSVQVCLSSSVWNYSVCLV